MLATQLLTLPFFTEKCTVGMFYIREKDIVLLSTTYVQFFFGLVSRLLAVECILLQTLKPRRKAAVTSGTGQNIHRLGTLQPQRK